MPWSRRQLLAAAALSPLVPLLPGGAPGVLGAIEPFVHTGPPRLLLGLVAYSLRKFFLGDIQKRIAPMPTEHGIDMAGFIDYCAEQGCAGAELTGYFLPKDLTGDVLQRVRRHAFLRGVAVTGTSLGNNFLRLTKEERADEIRAVKSWIDHAAHLGAPHLRVFAGTAPTGMDEATARSLVIESLVECAGYAGLNGVMLGLENHGGPTSDPDSLLSIVRAVESPWLGINLDSGNFHTADPYADFARCAPYAVNVQVKAVIKRKGAAAVEASDYGRLATILREAKYQGFVALEYEEDEDPWIAIPRELGKLKAAIAG
ncbi:MAG TPA: sugar phosphate isomerase/epimerase family protein [Planctomycetota bacterium]|nr:sugar phosphate isomerase/epimerase family protein [Planctomycetota bacterium]